VELDQSPQRLLCGPTMYRSIYVSSKSEVVVQGREAKSVFILSTHHAMYCLQGSALVSRGGARVNGSDSGGDGVREVNIDRDAEWDSLHAEATTSTRCTTGEAEAGKASKRWMSWYASRPAESHSSCAP
jgi:hypothetical protein